MYVLQFNNPMKDNNRSKIQSPKIKSNPAQFRQFLLSKDAPTLSHSKPKTDFDRIVQQMLTFYTQLSNILQQNGVQSQCLREFKLISMLETIRVEMKACSQLRSENDKLRLQISSQKRQSTQIMARMKEQEVEKEFLKKQLQEEITHQSVSLQLERIKSSNLQSLLRKVVKHYTKEEEQQDLADLVQKILITNNRECL